MQVIENTNDNNLMAALLEEYGQPVSALPGTLIQGTVERIDPKLGAWVSYGGKSDALVPADELNGITAGTTTLFYVLKVGEFDESPLFSARRAASWVEMSSAKESGETKLAQPFAIRRNGSHGVAGVSARMENGLTGFIPFTLAGRRGKALNDLVQAGNPIPVKVHEVDAAGRRLVLNHAAALEEIAGQQETARAERFSQINVGDVLNGTVATIARGPFGPQRTSVEYGAFVDVGADLQGLLHISECGIENVSSMSELLKPDQQIEVVVISKSLEGDKRRIGLSIKRLRQAQVLAKLDAFQVGDVVAGKVVGAKTFGTFVELLDGVSGLLHISEYSTAYRGEVLADGKRGTPRRTLQVGDVINVRILDIAQGRIKLSLRGINQGMTAKATA